GGNVNVKTGSGDDTVIFGGGLTNADTVDLGEGTLEVAGGDYSSASNETLKGINAALGVDHLRFTGATGATLDRSILVHGDFEILCLPPHSDYSATFTASRVFAFGPSHAGSATCVLEAFNTTLTLALEGSSQSATAAFDDANVGNLSATGALTINLI